MSFGPETTGGGLLDFIKTPEGMGLLSAVAGGFSGAKRGTPFNNIGRGLLSGISGYGVGLEQQKAAEEQARLKAERLAMQDAYKALLGQSPKVGNAAPNMGDVTPENTSGIGSSANYSIVPTVSGDQSGAGQKQNAPTVAAPMASQNPYLKMLVDGVPLEKVKGIYEVSNLGKPKIKNIETIAIDGKPTKVGLDEYGNQVAQIGMEWKPLHVQDFGGYVGGIDTTNPAAPVVNLGSKTMAPGETERIGLERRRVALAEQGQAFDQGLPVGPPPGVQVMGSAQLPGGPLPIGALNSGGQPNQIQLSKQLGKPPAGFRWTAQGNLEPVPGGPSDQKAIAVDSGRETVSKIIGDLRNSYNVLNENNAITSTQNRILTNLGAWSSSTGPGQTIASMFGTRSQKERDSIAQTRPLLMQAIMKATGMSAKQMDSNAELKMYLATATDPKLSLEANLAALDRLDELYGLSGKQLRAQQQAKPANAEKPASIKSDAEYNALPPGAIFVGPDGKQRRKP